MKKFILSALVFIFLLSITGCNKKADLSECLKEKDGSHYLILPISKEEVYIQDSDLEYLEDLDVDLLKKAEEKIRKDVSQYEEDPHFYITSDDDGYLCLSTEIIVDIDSPVPDENGNMVEGCGNDHEHKFFEERITR